MKQIRIRLFDAKTGKYLTGAVAPLGEIDVKPDQPTMFTLTPPEGVELEVYDTL